MFTKSDFKRVWTKLSIFRYYNEIYKCISTCQSKSSMESFIPIPHLYDIWGNKNLVRRVDDRFNCSFVVKNDSRLIIPAIESANRTNNKTFLIKTISNGILK